MERSQMFINRGMDKEDVVQTHTHTHTHRYYLAIKKNEIFPFAITWMELDGIMLSKITQRKTNTICVIYMWNLRNKTEEHR